MATSWTKRVYVVDTPVVLAAPGTGRRYTFVPYVPNGRFVEALGMAPGWETSELIFAHQDFKGAVYNGLASDTGDLWDSEDLPMVISGHIHDYQELPKVVYPGSPIQHAASERADKTLYWIEVGDDGEIVGDRVPIDVPIISTVSVAAADVPSYALPNVPPRSLLKVLVEGTYAEVRGLGAWPQVRAWRAAGATVQPKVVAAAAVGVTPAAAPYIPFRTKMADHVRGTPLESIWSSIVAQM